MPLDEISELEVESSKYTEYKLPLFEKKMISVPNQKLMQTAKANQILLENIKRAKS